MTLLAAATLAPDLSGLGNWVPLLESGTTLTQVAAGFTGSAEFLAKQQAVLKLKIAAADVVIIRRCTSEMRPSGNSTNRSTLLRATRAWSTDEPRINNAKSSKTPDNTSPVRRINNRICPIGRKISRKKVAAEFLLFMRLPQGEIYIQ